MGRADDHSRGIRRHRFCRLARKTVCKESFMVNAFPRVYEFGHGGAGYSECAYTNA